MMMIPTARPQGPPGTFILGHAIDLSQEGLDFLQQCARKYGDVVPLRFFWKQILFVNHPDYIEDVLATRARDVVKDIGQRADRPLIGNGLFLSEGSFWLRQRRMMQPAFHRERIATYGDVMVQYAERMVDTWRDGETRDIYLDMSQLTMGVVAKTLFGTDIWDDANEVADALTVALDCLSARVKSLAILLPDTLPTPTNIRLIRARKRIDKVVYRIIQQRRIAGDDRGDLLAMLLRAQDENGTHMTDQQVRDEVMTILVGGYETAADLLSWAWYLISHHTSVEEKLYAELADVLGARSPTTGDLPRLSYVSMIVSEALRLYPPAPALGREATTNFALGEYLVAKGTDILVSQWVIQRDPRYFADPDAFNPARWADGLASRIPRFAYFPFGGGPRICIGNSFAIMEATLVLAAIAQRFRLEMVPGHPVVPEMIPTLRPKYGMKMVVHRR